MKNKWILLVALMSATSLVAQVSSPRYALSMELAGSAGHQSVNFTLLPSTASGLSTEFGLGILYGQRPTLVVPVSINYLKRRNEKTVWKYGLGVTFTRLDFIDLAGNQPDDKGLYLFLVPAVTYLRTYPDGFFWGLKFSPLVGSGGAAPWGGVQLGFFF
jgi:hypothetical protein